MLTWHDVTGLIATTVGGGVIGYSIQMARHHWEHRRYHIVYDDDQQAVATRGRR